VGAGALRYDPFYGCVTIAIEIQAAFCSLSQTKTQFGLIFIIMLV